MKGQRLFLLDEKEIPTYLKKEDNKEVKFRLAFLNALLELSFDIEKACKIFSVSSPTAYAWVQVWNSLGYDGICHPFHSSPNPPGRPPSLDNDDIDLLRTLLSSQDNWEIGEVRKLIKETYGVDLSESQVGRILKDKVRMYFSKPYPHDYRRPDDAEEQLADSLGRAYKSLIDKGIDVSSIAIGFVDETSPQTTSNTARMWHMERHGCIIKNTARYKANAVGFYAIHGNSVQEFLPDSKKESIDAFISEVRSKNSEYQGVIIILDNFSSHHSALVRETAREENIELIFLPPYSPDLNPIEFIWKSVKCAISMNFVTSLSGLKELISQTWSDAVGRCTFARDWINTFVSDILPYRELCG
jgi:transposase